LVVQLPKAVRGFVAGFDAQAYPEVIRGTAPGTIAAPEGTGGLASDPPAAPDASFQRQPGRELMLDAPMDAGTSEPVPAP
jgi:hypothetical protein